MDTQTRGHADALFLKGTPRTEKKERKKKKAHSVEKKRKMRTGDDG